MAASAGVLLVHPDQLHMQRTTQIAEKYRGILAVKPSNTLRADYLQPKFKLAFTVLERPLGGIGIGGGDGRGGSGRRGTYEAGEKTSDGGRESGGGGGGGGGGGVREAGRGVHQAGGGSRNGGEGAQCLESTECSTDGGGGGNSIASLRAAIDKLWKAFGDRGAPLQSK